MEKAKVYLISNWSHCSQILTGLFMLRNEGVIDFEIIDQRSDANGPSSHVAAVKMEYNGRRLIFDTDDGYQNLDGMRILLSNCDYYFKRSYSPEKNSTLLSSSNISKIYPLGFNYHVTCKDNPYLKQDPFLKSTIKRIINWKSEDYYTPDKFEGNVQYKTGDMRILFMTRLWENGVQASKREIEENDYINRVRINIIRRLKLTYGEQFVGGLQNSKLAKSLAPDLVMPRIATERSRYLRLVHKSDICIGSMGLHESIGWKTAEYIAASKAIVNEELHYHVPGNFEEGKNYLRFTDVDTCLSAVNTLVHNPDLVYEMKTANLQYYQKYMRPDCLIKRCLDITDGNTVKPTIY